ncbi:hypothetical protein Fot_19521 [Forsythia ovata]|uniref:RNase H type-1 domain-containing protein n=1 Tax=Forsythia ovata TaxID=205694 RepID=A0ABD1VP21_9LAMI
MVLAAQSRILLVQPTLEDAEAIAATKGLIFSQFAGFQVQNVQFDSISLVQSLQADLSMAHPAILFNIVALLRYVGCGMCHFMPRTSKQKKNPALASMPKVVQTKISLKVKIPPPT